MIEWPIKGSVKKTAQWHILSGWNAIVPEAIIVIKLVTDMVTGTLVKIHKLRNEGMEIYQTLLLSHPVLISRTCVLLSHSPRLCWIRVPRTQGKKASTRGFNEGSTECTAVAATKATLNSSCQ